MRFSLLILTLAMWGCGGADRPRLVEVRGSVTFNGAPLEGAQIAMLLTDSKDPKYGRPARAISNAQGEFVPSSYGDEPGIPTGKYKVAVVKQEFPENYNPEAPDSVGVNFKWIVPRQFSDVETSGLTLEVTADGMVPSVLELTGSDTPEVENTRTPTSNNEP